jgi:hypothetical protein
MNQERIQKLISELQNGTDQQRRSASYKLRKYKDVSVVQELIKAYHDPDASVRQNVIEGLQIIGTKESQIFLISHGHSIQAPKSTEVKNVLLAFVIFILFILLLVFGYFLLLSNSLSKQCDWEGSAFTFVDTNADGRFQVGETPLPGITINLTRRSLQTQKFTTDINGVANLRVVFMGCPDLDIEIGVDPPEGMQLTTPAIYQVENPKSDERFIFGFVYMPGIPPLRPPIESP